MLKKIPLEFQLYSPSRDRYYVFTFLRFLKRFNTHHLNYYRVVIGYYKFLRPNKQ